MFCKDLVKKRSRRDLACGIKYLITCKGSISKHRDTETRSFILILSASVSQWFKINFYRLLFLIQSEPTTSINENNPNTNAAL
jgi:hypothetical protein